MVFSQDQRVFILEHYFSTLSYAGCQNAFRNSFPDSLVPSKSTIQRLVERLRETGVLVRNIVLVVLLFYVMKF
jgi:hypothetical protein